MAQDLATEFVADLYRRERTGIARSVARIAGESHAEDLVHDAFVAYLTKNPWATKPGAWVSTVARNRALNELRRPKLVELSGTETAEEGPPPEAEREAVRSVVAAALSALPERSLVAIRMKFFEGADYPQIAEALGVRVPQAHVVVHRALRRLGRELINRMAEAHGASGCAPALLRMAGLGGGDDSHAADPCPLCRPAWDEIVALKIGAWIPAPLVAFSGKLRSMFGNLAGRFTVRGSLASESVSWAATAIVSLGVAAGSLAPSTSASIPSVAQRVSSQVDRPAAGSSSQQVVAPAAPVTETKPAAKPAQKWTPPKQSQNQKSLPAGQRVRPPAEPGQQGTIGSEQRGDTTICTDVTSPCNP